MWLPGFKPRFSGRAAGALTAEPLLHLPSFTLDGSLMTKLSESQAEAAWVTTCKGPVDAIKM